MDIIFVIITRLRSSPSYPKRTAVEIMMTLKLCNTHREATPLEQSCNHQACYVDVLMRRIEGGGGSIGDDENSCRELIAKYI